MAQTCSIPGCQSNSNNMMLFQIPPPTEKYYEIGTKWIKLISSLYPTFPRDNIYRQYVCSKHFKDKHFITPEKFSLKSFAIPTVFGNGSRVYVRMLNLEQQQINNTASGMNTIHDISDLRNNNVYTNAIADCVTVPSVLNPPYNTIETRPTTRNVSDHTPLTDHAGLQEPSEQTVATSSRSLRTRKRKRVCEFCN